MPDPAVAFVTHLTRIDAKPVSIMTPDSTEFETLARALHSESHLTFSVLVGSHAIGHAQAESDWDIALQWARDLDWMTVLANTETLRHKLANALGVEISAIDLIELRRANLAMRVAVAEEGVPLSGDDTLDWAHFLQRTWRELEMFYWDKHHPARPSLLTNKSHEQ